MVRCLAWAVSRLWYLTAREMPRALACGRVTGLKLPAAPGFALCMPLVRGGRQGIAV